MITYHTYAEIKSQAAIWQDAIACTLEHVDALRKLMSQYEQVVFTGCGSTYYLSLAGAALFQALTGKSARATPGGELLLNTSTMLRDHARCLLIAVSRSGATTETVKAVGKFKLEQRGDVIVLTNYDSPLAQLGDLNIIIPEAQEESVAQTRSFTSIYVAVTALCAIAAGREDLLKAMSDLPKIGERLMGQYEQLARQLGENLSYDRFYFLGSGILHGLACEVSLKMKEMTLTHSEPFHFLEFRHGPMSMVNTNTLVVGLLSESNARQEQAVLTEMQALGATTLSLAEAGADISFESGVPEPVRGALYLPILQLLAFHRSLTKGLNPDRPNNLTAVVKLAL